MRIDPEGEHLTAFQTPEGVYYWRTLIQGCKISLPTFCYMMNGILGDLPFVLIYLDDILICSRNAKEHMEHLRIVFERLRKNQLYASRKKVQLFQR